MNNWMGPVANRDYTMFTGVEDINLAGSIVSVGNGPYMTFN